MPYHAAESKECPKSKPWAAIKTSTGEVMGCHATQESANAQVAALYANEPPKGNGQVRRAYARLEIKSIADNADGEMLIEGIASTPKTDRAGDIVVPTGARFSLPMAMLYQHKADKPIGLVTWAKPTSKGIPYKATIARAGVAPFIDEARNLIREGLVRGASIGFRDIKSAPIKMEDPFGGYRFDEWEWIELSAVTIPMNVDATVEVIRSYDSGAASGAKGSKPGGSGAGSHSQPKDRAMSTIQERISSLEDNRAASVARMEELLQECGGDFEALEGEKLTEYDETSATVKKVDTDLARFKAHEAAVAKAVPIDPEQTNTGKKGSEARQGRITYGKSRLEKGIPFARYCMALMNGKGSTYEAMKWASAQRGWKDASPEVFTCLDAPIAHLVQKTAVDVGTTVADTGNSTWAAPLVQFQVMASEFVELLMPSTIIGRIPGGLRRVPFNVKIPRQTAGASAKWVGEGGAKPVGKLDFDTITMLWYKAAIIAVLTEDLVRFSTPAADVLVRDDLIAQVQKFLDEQFVDPSVAGSPGTSPPSITNGLTPVSGTGSTIAQILADLASAWAKFDNAGLEPARPFWIMRPRTARYLTTLLNANGLRVFPDVTPTGGILQGAPVVTSGSVPFNTGTQTIIVLADANEILLADDGQVSVDVSREASVQMDDSPSAGAAQLVSLWQQNLVGIRAERFINYRTRRDGVGVTYIDSVAY